MPKVILLLDLSEEYGKQLINGIGAYIKDHEPWVCCRMPASHRVNYGIDWVRDWALHWQADGLIGLLENQEEVSLLQEAGLAVITQDLFNRINGAPMITGDYRKTGEMAAAYFLKNGYRNFAFYGFKDIVWSDERAQGFQSRLHQKGFEVEYFDHPKSGSGDLWYYQPSELSHWLTTLPKPAALLACDDNHGQQVLEACKLSGIRVPEDLAVLGVDNDEMICGISDPPLSSIALDTVKGGYDAAALMDQMIKSNNKNGPDIVVGPTQLHERRSSDCYASEDPYVKKALSYIHENINTNPRVPDLLEQIPLSRRAMEQRFMKATGFSPYKYICHLKVTKVCQQLLESDKAIFQIAIENGFDNSKNMSRLFKEMLGVTPKGYRKQHLIKMN